MADPQSPHASRPTPRPPQGGTVLAFDFGMKRTGVAVGELALGLAHPLATIQEESNERRFRAIETLIREWQPVLLVVGLPAHPDGTEHELSAQCRRFARRLQGRFGIETVLVDERWSSVAASESLREAGVRGARQKAVTDRVAAQLILQGFFESRQDGKPSINTLGGNNNNGTA